MDCQRGHGDIDSSQPRASVTIANLQASVHRSIEPPATEGELASLLENVSTLHAALPGGSAFSDEGAANHMRLAVPDNQPGINLFVYGDGELKPTIHRPRQRRAGSLAVARLHKLPADNTFFFQQHPAAIDAGAFHNDVVAMSHESLMIHHERAFLNADLQQLESRFAELTGVPLRRIEVSDSQLSLADAVATYLFNSQIVSPPGTDRPAIVCPAQVAKHPAASRVVQRWADDSLFDQPRFVDLDQSMDAGGGPACLRLRVPVTPDQLGSVRGGRWDERLDEKLREIIEREYPRSLTLAELAQADFCAHARKVTSTLRRVLLP